MPTQTYNTKSGGQAVKLTDKQFNKLTPEMQARYTPTNPISTPLEAEKLQPAQQVPTPQPEAPTQQEVFQESLQGAVAQERATLDKTLAEQRTRVDSELQELKKEQQGILDKAEPLTEPFREKLQAKERERLQIEDNFFANQKLTNELEVLLNEGNALIARSKGLPIHQRAAAIRTNRTIQDVQARAGVIQAVMSARNNQIAQAQNMIDRSVSAIVADRNDSLNYYNTLLELNNADVISLKEEDKKLAEEQLNLVKGDLEQAKATADYIKGLMIDPQTAQFMADAGVSLTDTVEEVNSKLAKQSQVQQIDTLKNKLIEQGYEFVPFPTSNDNVQTFSVGGSTLSFRPPSTSLTAENIGGFTVLRDSTGKIVSTRVASDGTGGGGGTGGIDASGAPTSNSSYDTPDNFTRASQTILASGNLTKQQRGDVLNMLNSQGIEGAQRWWVNNKFTATQRDNFDLYSNGAAILADVVDDLDTTTVEFGPYKALAGDAKPWLTIQRDQEYVDLRQRIEFAQAQIRRGFYGTAVTESEAGTAKRFLIDDNDDLQTVQTKVAGMAAMLAFGNDASSLRPLGIKVDINDYLPQEDAQTDALSPEDDVFNSVLSETDDTSGYWGNLWGNTKSFVGSLFGQ